MINILKYLFNLDRRVRTYLRFIIESVVIFTIYIVWLLNSDGWEFLGVTVHIFNATIWVLAYKGFGLQNDRLRFSSLASYLPICKLSLLQGAFLAIECHVLVGDVEIISLFVFVLVSLNILVGLRILARQLIRREANKTRDNILVYGTSDVAIDLVNAMAFGKKYNVVGFVSDNPQSSGSLAGLPVVPLLGVECYASSHACKHVVLASQSLSSERQKEVLIKLDRLGLSVSYAPTIDRAFDYEVQLKAVKPEDVLGRASEIAFENMVHDELHNKTILVTGAGGSIGSEICRQILRYQPVKLIILEFNEFALYTIDQQISELLKEGKYKTQLNCYLGSVSDEVTLSKIFQEHEINVVYHAAAYKHVPILENNIIACVSNNVFGTKCVAECANHFGVDKFVFVSSDKAVRPTNVMGASKRLAELVIQDLSKSSKTIFTMVRFGNVLGSSGSVIPKFKSQINAGGPLTVTHEEITRYFMSIPEAAHLVLNAGTFASGGDVFLLDMGDPIKIVELAKSMVRQHGLQPVLVEEIKDRQKKNGEILIEITGLRPGEKLYEELLVDGRAQKTPNPKIFKSHDGVRKELDFKNSLKVLERNIKENQPEEVINQLCKFPLEYEPNTGSVFKTANFIQVERINKTNCEIEENQQLLDPLMIERDSTSLLHRIVGSKMGLKILHRYFLMTRGMTLGVRVLVTNQNDEILLVRHSYVSGWHLPGGGVDHGEDIEAAARRELLEETGIFKLDGLQFINLEFNNAVSDRDHVSYFRARTNQNTLKKPTSEILEVRFFSCEIASSISIPEHRKYILESRKPLNAF